MASSASREMVTFNKATGTYSQIFTIKGYTDSIAFEVKSPNEGDISIFFNAFMSVFPGVLDFKTATIHPKFQNTENIRSRVIDFVDLYGDKFIVLKALPSFFKKIKDDEVLLLFPFGNLTQEESSYYYTYLASLAEGKDVEKALLDYKNFFGDFLTKYEVHAFGDRPIKIGKGLKKDRICRFCNNTRVPNTFDSVAHAISEALGNKKVKLNEECDGCNNFFARTIEPNIVEYFSVFRTMHDVKGKKGIKKVKGRNFSFGYEKHELGDKEELTLTYFDGTDTSVDKTSKEIVVPLEHNNQIAVQNLYKCLVKYFISVVDSKHLLAFTETVKWLNGEVEISKLPKVVEIFLPQAFVPEPKITTYIRKIDDKTVPFAVGEFQFTVFRFVFIVPGCVEDDRTFVDDSDFSNFFLTFEHYNKINHKLVDWSDNKKRNFVLSFDINLPAKEKSK